MGWNAGRGSRSASSKKAGTSVSLSCSTVNSSKRSARPAHPLTQVGRLHKAAVGRGLVDCNAPLANSLERSSARLRA